MSGPLIGGVTVTLRSSYVSGRDEYGNDVRQLTDSEVGGCAFAPGATTEDIQGTEQVTADAELYMPSGTVVTPEDQIVYAGVTYQVTGCPVVVDQPVHGTPRPGDGPAEGRHRRLGGARGQQSRMSLRLRRDRERRFSALTGWSLRWTSAPGGSKKRPRLAPRSTPGPAGMSTGAGTRNRSASRPPITAGISHDRAEAQPSRTRAPEAIFVELGHRAARQHPGAARPAHPGPGDDGRRRGRVARASRCRRAPRRRAPPDRLAAAPVPRCPVLHGTPRGHHRDDGACDPDLRGGPGHPGGPADRGHRRATPWITPRR